MIERGWHRLSGVDLLRGLAILLVLLNHVNMRLVIDEIPYTKGLPEQLVHTLVWSGQYGVQIFFAVSGFLISSMPLRRWGALSNIPAREFYSLRFARIAPLLLLLLAVLVGLHFTGSQWFAVPPENGGVWRALLAALTFHVNWLEANYGYLPPNWDILWSLSVEEVFYIGFPIACILLGRRPWLVVFLVLFVVTGPIARAVLAGHNETWLEYSYLGGMDAIALGCLTALAAPGLRMSERGFRAVRVLGIFLIIFVLGCSTVLRNLGLVHLGMDMTLAALGACCICIASGKKDLASNKIWTPVLWFGERSYEIYLTHMFVVIGFYEIFTQFGKPLAAVPALLIISILVSGIVGHCVAKLFSEPMNQILRSRFGVERSAIDVASSSRITASKLKPS